ncbi:methionine--tRNA ligase [Candidatus Woesearchaeota archaeon]|nr:methionine--tRNA ligase [Candidatus Woesearchaeota archaeon]
MTKKKFYITSAIAYPNSVPHLGHALEIIQADALARFYKLKGEDVFFQTGTDEHGTKNWQTAEKEGLEIKKFLDRNVAVFVELYKLLNIDYDNFIRTTDKKHHEGAQKLWKKLAESGDLYKKKYKGLYCVGCESFKTEKELVEGKCPNHPTREIQEVEEENYFFKLSKYAEKVAGIISKDEYKVIPESRKNEILSWLKEAKDISFSRPKSSLVWGIPVPDDENHVMYVWCDALSNYITGVGYGDDAKKFSQIWPCDIHVIGKDILRFHAGFWPAMLLSAGVELPKRLFVHGFLQVSGLKMGKSTGNVVDPFFNIKKYGVDPFRFYILGAMPMDGDGDYSDEAIVERINNELVANIANFVYRTLSYTNKALDSSVTEIDEDREVIDRINELIDKVINAYEGCNFKEALSLILEISAIGNKYMQEKEPWKTIKDDKEGTRKVLGTCVNIAKILSILLEPVMPGYCSEIKKQLNLEGVNKTDLNFETKHHKIGKAEILLKKVELVKDDIFPLDLKVAEIKEVSDHPEADKLFVMKINCDRERNLVAGLREYYKKEELLGKKIVIVSNLKPAKLRGILSEGMLLAAQEGDKVKVLEVKDAKPGCSVKVEGYENNTEQIKFEDFEKIKLTTKNGKVVFDNIVLKADGEEIFVDIGDNAIIK